MEVLQSQAPITSFSGVSANLTAQCVSSTLPSPTLFGAEILSVDSSLVTNYTASFLLPPTFFNSDPPYFDEITNLSFCNVTVTYTHPGQNDYINVNIWLPLSISEDTYDHTFLNSSDRNGSSPKHDATDPSWNGLLVSHGGGGFATSLPSIISHSSLVQGFAISTTDGGHGYTTPVEDWALTSPGNVNLYLLQDFASVALHDMSVIAKDVVTSFYGVKPRYSYFQGCSTGGRQGLMLAQRYPDAYDGILAAAPAIYFPKLMVWHFYAQMLMNQLGEFPRECEFDALTKAAIDACDGLDGVKDGIVSAPELCNSHFDPASLVGKDIPCLQRYADEGLPEDGRTEAFRVKISPAAVQVASAIWDAPATTHNASLWHSLSHSAPLSSVAATECFRNHTCTGDPNYLTTEWIRLFLYKNPTLTASNLSELIDHTTFVDLFKQSDAIYHSMISTTEPDLSAFAKRGGKMITWHGLDDEGIMPGQSLAYYQSVLRFAEAEKGGAFQDPGDADEQGLHVKDFYRFFQVPGVQHCGNGIGAIPINVMSKLRTWVEDGTPPEELDGESFAGEKIRRPICAYPLVAKYKGGGDWRARENWACVE